MKCLKAVSPSPPIPHTMYCCSLSGSSTWSQSSPETDRMAREHGTDRQTDRQTDRWTKRQTDRQRDKQTDRWMDKQTDRQSERQTDRQTDRQMCFMIQLTSSEVPAVDHTLLAILLPALQQGHIVGALATGVLSVWTCPHTIPALGQGLEVGGREGGRE